MTELTLELAQRHTQTFADDVKHSHHNAMECYDCQEMLQHGIDAFNWIQIAEKVLREGDAAGLVDIGVEVDDAINSLWEMWLRPVEGAEKKIAQTRAKGFIPDNMHEFNRVKEHAFEIVESNQLINLGRRRLFESLADEE